MTGLLADLSVKIGLGVNPIEKYAEVIRSTPIPKIDRATNSVIKGLRQKIREEGLIVTKADKSNAVVVMKKSAYESRVFEVLAQCGATKSTDLNISQPM